MLRGLAMPPAAVVIVPEGTTPLSESLHPQADDYIAKNHLLFRDLPIVVSRAVARARGYQPFQHTELQAPPTRARRILIPVAAPTRGHQPSRPRRRR